MARVSGTFPCVAQLALDHRLIARSRYIAYPFEDQPSAYISVEATNFCELAYDTMVQNY